MDLGSKLKTIRTNSVPSLTQNDVANKLNMPIQTYARYENGYRNPKNSQIHEFAQFYGVASFLLDPDNWSYVPLDTKGDLIALIVELFKKGIVGLIPDIVIDQDIVDAVTRWIDMYKMEYLPLRDTSSDKVNQFILDELDRLQIQLTLQYRQPLKKKHDSEKR